MFFWVEAKVLIGGNYFHWTSIILSERNLFLFLFLFLSLFVVLYKIIRRKKKF